MFFVSRTISCKFLDMSLFELGTHKIESLFNRITIALLLKYKIVHRTNSKPYALLKRTLYWHLRVTKSVKLEKMYAWMKSYAFHKTWAFKIKKAFITNKRVKKNILNIQKYLKFYTQLFIRKKNAIETIPLLSRFKYVQQTNIDPYELLKSL